MRAGIGRSRWVTLALTVLVTVVLGLVCLRLWKVETSITAFLPDSESRELYDISSRLADSTLTRRMVLSLGPPSLGEEELSRSAARLAERLGKSPRVASVRRGVGADVEKSFYELYFPRRFRLLSDAPERDLPKRLSDAGLAQNAERLSEALASPEGILVRRLAPRDPLQAFPEFLERLEAASPGDLRLAEGQFFSRDGHAIVFLELADSAFQSERQRELLSELDSAFQEARAQSGGTLVVESTGINRFAVASESAMKDDMARISTLSTAGLLFVYLLLYRRPSRLIFTLIPVVLGTLVALTACLLIFGRVHVLTLAFGSSLIGVAIDFPVHLINHHDLGDEGRSPLDSLGDVLPSLFLAGGTSILGLLGLGFSGFPGVREMSVFAVAGVTGGLLAVALIAPLLGPAVRPSRTLEGAAHLLGRVLTLVRHHRRGAWALLALALVLGSLGLTRVRWQNDLNALNQPNPTLLAEDARLRARVGDHSDGRFLVAVGKNVEEALQKSERALPELEALRAKGALDRFASVHDLLWSRELQERNLEALRAAPNLAPRMEHALSEAGFVPELFAEFRADLARALAAQPGPDTSPLSFELLAKSPLEPMISPFVVQLGDKAAVVTHLSGVSRPAEIAETMQRLPGIHYFDQGATIDALYVDVRSRTVKLIALGLVVVCGAVFARYRKLRPTLAAVLPACVSGIATLGILALFGVELNLLHVISLLLVLSMGEDYGVFLVDAARSDGHDATPAAMMSIVLACLSTVLSFGLLGLSAVPALRSMGQTVALGDILCLVLAPIAAALIDKPTARAAERSDAEAGA